MPVFDTPPDLLAQAIASVRRQTYRCWELCIADDASPAPHGQALRAQAAEDRRIRTTRLPANAGIAAATNAALAMAQGAFVALLDHDDELAPHALARVAAEIAAFPDAELIFSDEDKRVGGRRCAPYFKPGWNADLMLGQNLVSHLGVYRRARLLDLGGLRAGFEGSQDYDLALRVADACGPSRIRHIPEILYHWRQLPGSFSATRAEPARQAARQAIAERQDETASVQPDPVLPQWNRVVHGLPDPPPLVSIIAGGEGPVATDPSYDAVEVLRGDPARAAAAARGEVLLLLSPGLRPAGAGWLREMVSQAWRPGVGAVGGRLDRPDGRILQSGLVLDPARIATTLRPRSDLDDPGYVGNFRLARTVSAVSRDCLAIRRALYLSAGGLDPRCGPYADVDLCLRLAVGGLRCVWTPYARLGYIVTHPVRADRHAARLMRARWGNVLARDPYLNPNLVVRHGNLALRVRPGGPPRMHPA